MRQEIHHAANVHYLLRSICDSGLLRRRFLSALDLLKQLLTQHLGKLRIQCMPRTNRNEVCLDRHPNKHDITDDIEDLMAHEFFLKAQWLFRQNFVALNHNRTVKTASFDLPQFKQLLDVLVNREGTRRCDLCDIRLGVDIKAQVLRMNATIICGCAGHAKTIVRQRNDRTGTASHRNRLVQNEIFALRILLYWLGLLD